MTSEVSALHDAIAKCSEPPENKTPMTGDILKPSDKWRKYFIWYNKKYTFVSNTNVFLD